MWNHSWVSFTGFSESYNGTFKLTGHTGLSAKNVSSAFFNGELENEMRERGHLDMFHMVKVDMDKDKVLAEVEKVVDVCLLLMRSGIAISSLYAQVKSPSSKVPIPGLPDVCTNPPVHGQAFCSPHCEAVEKTNTQSGLHAFLKHCRVSDSTFNDVAAVLSKLEPSSGGTSVIEAQAVGMHNTGEFTALVDELSEWLIGQGVTNLWRLQFEEKEAVVKDLFVHHIYHRVQSCIQQFTDGLGPLYGEMRRHPKALGSLFVVDNKPLSLPSFRKLYDIEYSAQGSNNRNREDTIYCWELFLQRAEEKDEVTLEKILEFWTGAGKPPPAGFNHKLHIQFFSQETGVRRLPSSSTWAMVLWLPRGVEDPQQFQAMMTNAILETQGFGKM
ncbi:uncharacterized protein LOC110988173 isoform X1 [Acanthaster planci]|uniref:Uncharacterized protein LOC110988173 isoform X1 n=1 Tax=Acanthaster planci TaxID=133434 RepID=A0A8B7ZUH8_ACAPL|nr:uncharacterized protein LOC110988173 isoform X1 [Acanthaster planci]